MYFTLSQPAKFSVSKEALNIKSNIILPYQCSKLKKLETIPVSKGPILFVTYFLCVLSLSNSNRQKHTYFIKPFTSDLAYMMSPITKTKILFVLSKLYTDYDCKFEGMNEDRNTKNI